MMHPQRVVSLWDMMYSMGGSITAIANIVLAISQVNEALDNPSTTALAFRDRVFQIYALSIEEIRLAAASLGLDATLSSATSCQQIMSRATLANGTHHLPVNEGKRFAGSLDNLRQNFLAQMESRLVLVIDGPGASFMYSDDPPYGRAVEDAFPKATAEISEASKCLALQRPTAVMFHLMRAMECAVQRLAQVREIEKFESLSWGPLLSSIENSILRMPKGSLRDAWSATHVHLYHVKQAWRNDTMHPKTTYTEDEALKAFQAVGSFMAHLAPLVSVAGQP